MSENMMVGTLSLDVDGIFITDGKAKRYVSVSESVSLKQSDLGKPICIALDDNDNITRVERLEAKQ